MVRRMLRSIRLSNRRSNCLKDTISNKTAGLLTSKTQSEQASKKDRCLKQCNAKCLWLTLAKLYHVATLRKRRGFQASLLVCDSTFIGRLQNSRFNIAVAAAVRCAPRRHPSVLPPTRQKNAAASGISSVRYRSRWLGAGCTMRRNGRDVVVFVCGLSGSSTTTITEFGNPSICHSIGDVFSASHSLCSAHAPCPAFDVYFCQISTTSHSNDLPRASSQRYQTSIVIEKNNVR